MTIEYKDSKRIVGLESDKTTTEITGYDGGSGIVSSRGGGGGGGAGAVGGDAQGNYNPAGDGGIGKQSDITGTNTYYAGGGGGGRDYDAYANSRVGYGGSGGGGNGQVAGTANTGGGGGGGSGNGGSHVEAGVGGSGVVILQFTTSGTSYSTTGSPTVDTSSVSGKTILKYTGSGTFVLTGGTPDVRYLVVAGGGAGYTSAGTKRATGGGGAGGFRTGTKSSMANATYTVTVGAGGAVSNNGSNSVFSDITSTGGGAGALNSVGNGSSGGSGGGGGEFAASDGSYGNGGSGTTLTYANPSMPTDIQDNSLFVEKDTARRYWFDAQTGTTPTYNDDFSTYADQAAADAVWVSNDTADFRVNITNDNFDFDSKVTSTTNTGAYYDLGSALSDTAWVVDFKLVITTNTLYSGGSVSAATYITMNDATNGGAIGGTVDAMGFYVTTTSSGSKFCVTWANSSYLNRGGGEFTNTITTGTFYMRLKRTGATSVKLEVYSDATRTSSSLIEEKEVTGTDSGITGLRYLRIQDNQSSAGTGTGQQIGTIDDVCIYDGVTTATAPYSPAIWTKQTSAIPTVSGLKLHLDASDSTTITKDSNNYISAWNDKSGEGNHLSQSTASKQPLWVNDTLDTLPVIRFDGSDDFMNRSTFVNGAISQGFYMFVVMRPSSSGVSYNFDSAAGTRGFCYSNNTVIQYGCGTDIQIDSTIPTTHVMYTFFVNGASSNVRKNSTSINSSNLGSSTINGLWLATRYNEANKGNVEFAEVLIYDNDIGTTNRDAIESYLTDKWGL